MGVPKFYRWISERYPCLSEEVKEFQLPEFDNLYLDMNGIVHVCSHPDDENPHFRITEEKIFKDICHYIDFLFRMIKPRRVFFMAVDGVAPRAKMNQQRGRRFRSAREAEQLIEKAKKAGETLPTEKRFDSNCITPGTPFMVRLQEHLKYFVVTKITNDPLWQGPKIYLSGHETPGEGEHKVMDYIRWAKSQPGYDGNTRHCLYGLDADLIMLGLTSHEPCFSLLREEVRFGGKKDRNNKRTVTPEETTFHLLHLSLLRDYLAYEFSSLKGKLSFEWDLERLIDDWVLMGFLVGNDFIPHLPRLHIHHDALPILWTNYIKVLPKMDGYINQGGHLNLPRLERYFEELAKYDVEEFENAFSDLSYLESKLGGKSINESAGQAAKLRKLKPFTANSRDAREESLVVGGGLEELSAFDDDDDDINTLDAEFELHKKDYYMSKMNYTNVTLEVMQEQAHGYVRALQWILLYYFEGVPSWSWYYPHHYAPYISDVHGFKDMVLTFDLSHPFLPFQQLMAVLPAASKELLPPALQTLMTEETSEVIDFYPVNFDTDLNGKQQEWEAVVLIPFINEKRLLSSMASKEHLLTSEEKSRNCHGPHLLYEMDDEDQGFYPSSLPGVFPDLACSRARCTRFVMDLFRIESSALKKGLSDGLDLDVYSPGFPTLRFLQHTHELESVGVKVFQHNSRNRSMVLRVSSEPDLPLEMVADELLGKTTHVGWPHLHEAKVVAVANESFKIELIDESLKKTGRESAPSFNRVSLDDGESAVVAREATTIKDRHMDRFAIDVGNTEIIVYASTMTGRRYTYANQRKMILEKQFATNPIPFAYQMTVGNLRVLESSHAPFKTLEEVYTVGSPIFMLGNPHYGAQGKVKEILTDTARIRIALNVTEEPDMRELGQMHMEDRYMMAYQASKVIGVDGHILARITGSVFVEQTKDKHRVNLGLNLKFTKRCEEVPGYTRKEENGWTYSKKCLDMVSQYISRYHDVWLRIQRLNVDNDILSEVDVFPEGSGSTLKEVTTFLQELPCAKAPRMKFGAEILDEEQVARIEAKMASMNKVPNIVKIRIKPFLLFKPLVGQGSLVPDPDADFFLYDRVAVVKSGYSVPFGKRGTIIGIPPEETNVQSPHRVYDVVFDEAFTGGITLRCSANRGYRVPGSAMLNLTFGEFRKNRPLSQRVPVGAWNGGKLQSQKRQMDNNRNTMTAGQQLYNDRAGPYVQSGSVAKGHQKMWDAKGQPLFGQVFASGQMNHGANPTPGELKFVTPKVQVPHHGVTTKKPVPSQKTDGGVDFDRVWKSLVGQEQPTATSPKETIANSQKMPTMNVLQSDLQFSRHNLPCSDPSVSAVLQSVSVNTDQSKSKPVPAVQSMLENAPRSGIEPQPSTENTEFLAMFNSLKIQSEEMRRSYGSPSASVPISQTSVVVSPSGTALAQTDTEMAMKNMMTASPSESLEVKAKTADDALKQMLKIGNPVASDNLMPSVQSPSSGVDPSAKTSRTSPSYGRQVSLQELFDEASRHLSKHQTTATSVSTQETEAKPAENRDPMTELEAYCKASGLPPPSYDFKHQHKQNSYIANVFLVGRGRYEGSLCHTKAEATKSAASMALLCLKSQATIVHPALAGLLPVPTRPGAQQHQFFSANSAFSPIGLPVSSGVQAPQHRPPSMMPPPTLLTPQHFIGQPRMSPLHQQRFNQQQQHLLHQHLPHHPMAMNHQQQQQLQFQQQQLRHQLQSRPQVSLPPSLCGQPMAANSFQAHSASQRQPTVGAESSVKTTSSSSTSQPFIPLQVSRKQKTSKGKKESETEDNVEESLSSVANLPTSILEALTPHAAMLVKGESHEKDFNETNLPGAAMVPSSVHPSGHRSDGQQEVTSHPQPLSLLGQNGAFPSSPSSVGLGSSATTASSPGFLQASEATTGFSELNISQPQGNQKPKVESNKKKSRLAANFSKKV